MPTGCARIRIENGPINDDVDIKSTNCSTNKRMNTIVCESLDLNTGICPTMPVTEVMKTTTVQQAVSVLPTVSQSFVTDGIIEKYTSTVFMHPSKGNQSDIETGPDVPMVAIITSIVVITIAIILLVLLFMRRSQKRKGSRNTLGPNQHVPSTGPPINKDGATVSYSEGGVVHKYSTAEDHQDRSEAYNILDAKDIHSPTVVVNGVYAVPHKDAAPTNSAQDQEYDMLNGMDSGASKQNGLGGGVYAVPNKKAKAHNGETNQDVDEPYATLDADDMQPVSEHHGRESDNAFDDALYVNTNAHCLQDEGEAYNALNAADMHSDRDNSGDVYDVPYKESSTGQQDHGDVYDMLNGTQVRLDNEYGKLNASDNMLEKDGMYSYVETEVGGGIVTMSPGEEDHAYDKLQRNTKLDGASINGNNYNTLQWFNCSGPSCYLIYPDGDGWKYQDPGKEVHVAESDVYESPNCYKFIKKDMDRSSCINAQRECELTGGGIAVINSTKEYNQLVKNVIHILSFWADSTFSVHIQNLPRDSSSSISNMCAAIEIKNRVVNRWEIKSTDCSTIHLVDTVVCESAEFNTEICPIPVTTEVMQTTKVQQTRSMWPTVNRSFVTKKATEKYTSIVFIHPSKGNQSVIETGPNLSMVAIITSIVVITIAIILLVCLFFRRTQKKRSRNSLGPNQHLPTTGLPIDKDGATVSYSEGGVVHKYSTAEDHQDRSEAYNILDAKDIHSQTVVFNDAYAVPHTKDAATTNSAQDQEYDMLNVMDSGTAVQNGLSGGVYAVPNKKSKGRKDETKPYLHETYDTFDVDDMQAVSEQHRKESDDALDAALYVNANSHCLQDEGEAYNALNAADMHSDRDNSGDVYDVPYKESSTGQQDHGGVYDMLNGTQVRLDNEYGKLNASDNMLEKDGMYSYVETEVGGGIVTMSPGEEDHAYDKLQRNTKLDGALINDNNYSSL
ncbi:uncharacterized protein LOC117117346 [Anneissia japonica]|uniref:uncharacterized protein LOC117117346 n=1 Tax=Anneissia japonica TaxID=1529436 RepID=UPI00142571D4|nr:uncharacterized protein LOC117117346 [Anneissia japonica]